MKKILLVLLICFFTFESFSQNTSIPPGPNDNIDPIEFDKLEEKINLFYDKVEGRRPFCPKFMNDEPVVKDIVSLVINYMMLDADYIEKVNCGGETKNGPIVKNIHHEKVDCIFNDPDLLYLGYQIATSPASEFYFGKFVTKEGAKDVRKFFIDIYEHKKDSFKKTK